MACCYTPSLPCTLQPEASGMCSLVQQDASAVPYGLTLSGCQLQPQVLQIWCPQVDLRDCCRAGRRMKGGGGVWWSPLTSPCFVVQQVTFSGIPSFGNRLPVQPLRNDVNMRWYTRCSPASARLSSFVAWHRPLHRVPNRVTRIVWQWLEAVHRVRAAILMHFACLCMYVGVASGVFRGVSL
jgi:hypothetical protein